MLEAVRRRFEQSGLETRDLGLVEAILRAGYVALALDGTNEADRDAALAAFVRQFPMVRVLATSQAAGMEGWETWRLPEDVAALREGLLQLWLGRRRARSWRAASSPRASPKLSCRVRPAPARRLDGR